jgi:hypothetical protein
MEEVAGSTTDEFLQIILLAIGAMDQRVSLDALVLLKAVGAS